MDPTKPIVEEEVADQTDNIDFVAIAMALWQAKWLLLLFLAIAIAGSATYLNLATYRYTAQMQLTAAEHSASRMPSGLAGLGSIVGVDIGPDSGTSFALFGEAVRSRAVAERLAGNDRIMRGIFSAHWDADRQQWREPNNPVRAVTRPVKQLLGIPDAPWQQPGAGELRDVLQTRLGVSEDRKKGITTLRFEHPDGELARYLIEQAATEADGFLREKALARANDYVSYLEERLRDTQVAEYRLSLAQNLIGYENMRMMASADSAFAAEAFGPSIVSRRPTSPNPMVVVLTSMLAALLLWAAYVLLLHPLLGRQADRADS